MRMPPLTRRTHLLLDEERYRALEQRAAVSGRSVAALIREAIDVKLREEEAVDRRRAAARRLLEVPQLEDGREPDWEAVKSEGLDARLERWYR
jgi:plasmid stability protein